MRIARLLVCALSLIVVAAVCSPSLGADKGKKAKPKAAAPVQDNVLVAELQAAFAVIDRAEPSYHGHRGKAKHEINAAIGQLQEMHKHGLKAHHKPSEKETRAESDVLIGQGVKAVTAVLGHINSLPDSKHRATAKAHLTKSLEELKTCLAVSKVDQAKKAK